MLAFGDDLETAGRTRPGRIKGRTRPSHRHREHTTIGGLTDGTRYETNTVSDVPSDGTSLASVYCVSVFGRPVSASCLINTHGGGTRKTEGGTGGGICGSLAVSFPIGTHGPTEVSRDGEDFQEREDSNNPRILSRTPAWRPRPLQPPSQATDGGWSITGGRAGRGRTTPDEEPVTSSDQQNSTPPPPPVFFQHLNNGDGRD